VRLSVRLFSLFRERVGSGQLELEVPESATVEEAVAALWSQNPSLPQDWPQDKLLVAVNRDYATMDRQLAPGDEVAVFPPVSGGEERPLGVLMISGGIDSPVAGYMMIQNGWDVAALHMDNRPFTDDREVDKAFDLIRRLEAATGRKIQKFMAPHKQNQLAIARNTDRHMQCVLCRRMMWRTAEALAARLRAQALITGENLGQVASQTLENMNSHTEAVTIPMIRPLLGLDKTEIMSIAREIGTFEISTRPGLCCTIVPEKPATTSTKARTLSEESKIDPKALLAQALEGLVEVE
jgi:tRNA uracil 4-sulfurtransferase